MLLERKGSTSYDTKYYNKNKSNLLLSEIFFKGKHKGIRVCIQ